MFSKFVGFTIGAAIGTISYVNGMKKIYYEPEFVEDSEERKSVGPGLSHEQRHFSFSTKWVSRIGSLTNAIQTISIIPEEEDAMWEVIERRNPGKLKKMTFALGYISTFSLAFGVCTELGASIWKVLIKGYEGTPFSLIKIAGSVALTVPTLFLLLVGMIISPAYLFLREVSNPYNHSLGFAGKGLKRNDPVPAFGIFSLWKKQKYEIRLHKGHPLLRHPFLKNAQD